MWTNTQFFAPQQRRSGCRFGCTLTETELTCTSLFARSGYRDGASSLSLAAAAELAASSTISPSLKLTTRTWRARSGGRKPSTSPASAR